MKLIIQSILQITISLSKHRIKYGLFSPLNSSMIEHEKSLFIVVIIIPKAVISETNTATKNSLAFLVKG